MQNVKLFLVETTNQTFLVNTNSEEKAKQIVKDERLIPEYDILYVDEKIWASDDCVDLVTLVGG